MKRLMFFLLLMALSVFARGQIYITSDSLVMCKWNIESAKYIPTSIIKENMSIEIDKDLLALKVSGKTHDMAYVEKAFLIDFHPKKMVSFITAGKETGYDTPLEMFYYSISDIKINYDAIDKHLKEKGDKKY
jgi:hypothetical protein